MENKGLLAAVISATVAIILIGSMLAPIIAGLSDTPLTVSNDINRPATLIDANDDVNIVIELGYSTPFFKINGVDVIRDEVNTWYYVLASDGFSINYHWLESSPMIVHNNYGQVSNAGVSTVVTTDLTITISQGNINITYGNNSFDRTFTWASYIDPFGDGLYQNYFAYSGIPMTNVYFKNVNDLRGASTSYVTPNVYYAFVGDSVRLNPNNADNVSGMATATIFSQKYLDSDIRVLEFGRPGGGYSFEYLDNTIHTWSLVVPTEITGVNSPVGGAAYAMLVSIPAILLIVMIAGFALVVRNR